MTAQLDQFKVLLKEFRALSVWAVGGGAAVPFAADLASLSPPWPKGIVVVTALIELVALVLVYQLLAKKRRKTIDLVMSVSALVLAVASIAYLFAVSYYTFEAPNTHERFVKGITCMSEVMLANPNKKCLEIGLAELHESRYEATRVWTEWSISIVRVCLVVLWSSAFAALSVLLGSFLVFQTKTQNFRRRTSATLPPT